MIPHQIAANHIIPLPEPARRGPVNPADDVAAATNRAIAAAAQLNPFDHLTTLSTAAYVQSGGPPESVQNAGGESHDRRDLRTLAKDNGLMSILGGE